MAQLPLSASFEYLCYGFYGHYIFDISARDRLQPLESPLWNSSANNIYSRFQTWYLYSRQDILKKKWALHNLLDASSLRFNPFKPVFTIVIFIHYKSRIAVAILDL